MTPLDISHTLAPKSDQLDAVDLAGGPRTFTIERVTSNGNDDQPLNVHLVEFPRVWRPSKGMRRVLAAAWGVDGDVYAGRRVTLYCDTEVMFGAERVGGIRISHLSHIDKPLHAPTLVKRGKSGIITVQPLTERPARPSDRDIEAATDIEALGVMWHAANARQRKRIEERAAELKAAAASTPPPPPEPEPPVEELPFDPTVEPGFGATS